MCIFSVAVFLSMSMNHEKPQTHTRREKQYKLSMKNSNSYTEYVHNKRFTCNCVFMCKWMTLACGYIRAKPPHKRHSKKDKIDAPRAREKNRPERQSTEKRIQSDQIRRNKASLLLRRPHFTHTLWIKTEKEW